VFVNMLGFIAVVAGLAQAPVQRADTVSIERTSIESARADTTPPSMAWKAKSLLPVTDTLLNNPADTVRRRHAIVYSEWYGTRATIHRRLSYTMIPLFALSYFTGQKLFNEGTHASDVTLALHQGSAGAVSVLFGLNTITGGINLWQGRHDPAQRKRKILHAVLFTAASAGFAYAGVVLADGARYSLSKRTAHRNMTLFSMGLSVSSVLVMMVGPS
jgi:hypothetical protein